MKKETKYLMIALIGISFVMLIGAASALVINSVSMTQESIAPGENSEVALSIKNNGDNDLTDVSVSLDFANLPLAPYNSGSEYTLSELNSDKTKEVMFNIIASSDAKSGIYKIPVKIEYTEDDQPKTRTSLISIMINSKPIIEVNYDDGLLLKGQNNKIAIKIINKGLGDVKFLETEAGSSMYYSMISQNKVYVGDVDSNDFQTAEFNVFLNEKTPASINFPVKVRYRDITNKEYEENYNLKLKAYTVQQAQNLGLIPKNNTIYIVILIVVLIIVFFVYRAIRNRRKRRQNENQ